MCAETPPFIVRRVRVKVHMCRYRTAMAASRYPPLQLVGALSDSRWRRRRQSRCASSAPTTLVPEIRKARRHGAQDKLDIRNC